MTFLVPMIASVVGASAATAGTLGTIASAASAAFTVLGGITSYQGQRRAAKQAEMVGAAHDAQLRQQAQQEEAVGQIKAQEARRKAEILMSRALAVSAASGAGTEGINSLMAGLVEEGEREAGYAKYSAGERAAGLRYRGAIARYEGKATAAEYRSAAAGTLLGSFAQAADTLASRFAPSEPPKTTPAPDKYDTHPAWIGVEDYL
jgi:hypothetical protein